MEKKYKTTWDLSHLYSSITDPQIEKDLALMERLYKAFEKKYKGRNDVVKSEKKLLALLTEYEVLSEKMEKVYPYIYAFLLKDTNRSDEAVQAFMSKMHERIVDASNHLIFFRLLIGSIAPPLRKKYLKSKLLSKYHYFLKRSFERSEYDLSEPEEKILSLLSLPANSLWVRGVEKVVSEKTVQHKGEQIPLSAARSLIMDLSTQDERYELYKKTIEKLKESAEFATAELNAIYTHKKIIDNLRKLKRPYSQTLRAHQISEQTLDTLRMVAKKYEKITQTFFKLKAELLGLDILKYSDRHASIGKTESSFPFNKSVEIVSSAFEKIGPWYKDTFHSYLNNGQIDAFPRKGKPGGAYCSGGRGRPTYILLNHVDKLDSVATMAHEMGHAFHGEMSATQGVLYSGYSTAVAEVASTLFENIVFEEAQQNLSTKEKVIALHDRIVDDLRVVFMQIAGFNIELEIHEMVRNKGNVSTQDILGVMKKHMEGYLGPACPVSLEDGYSFVDWKHLRLSFYMYTYAYGQLVSKALYAQYKKDPTFWKKIEQFLSAGGSKSPEQIFKDIGIDTSKPEFFELGIKKIGEDVKKLRELAKKEGMIKE